MKRWRQTINTHSVKIGSILVWLGLSLWVLCVGGGLSFALTGGTGADAQPIVPVVRCAVIAAYALFSLAAVMSLCIPDIARRAAVLQRIMFWLAGAGLAFLTVSWTNNKPTEQLAQVVMFWIVGGAMGLLLEPAKALLQHDSTRTGDEKTAP